MSDSEIFREHVGELERRALAGDEFAMRSLACMGLLASGWRHGDADQVEGGEAPPDAGGEVAMLDDYRKAA